MATTNEIIGKNIKLRCVVPEDNDFIVALRNHEETSNFIPQLDPIASLEWISRQRSRSGDYYFAIFDLKREKTVGFIGLYDFSLDSAEWGRWLVDKNPLAAVESVFLIHQFGFELGLDKIFCRTRALNSKVVSLHTRLPYSRRYTSWENDYEILHCELFKSEWNNFAEFLMKRIGKK
jgi:RimJ/RimL family protein N-acetyltransferase